MKYKLSELIDINHGFAFKGEDFSEVETKLFILTPGNVRIGGGFQFGKGKYLKEKTVYPEKFNLKNGTLFVSMTDLSKEGDTLGSPAIVPKTKKYTILHNQRLGVVSIKEEAKLIIDLHYLYYALRTREYHHFILGSATGTTVKHTSPKKILEYEIMLPAIQYQKKVAEILDNFESKIELNNQMIATLEELAATLFKRWFVDFEFPDENGNPYKSSGGKMVESELGEVPEGWKVRPISQIAKYKNGLAMQKYRPEAGQASLPVLKIKELNQGFTDENSDRCSTSISDDVKIYNGDVIFSWSGTLLVKLWSGGEAGLNQHLFKVTSSEFDKWFYYLWTKFYLNAFQAAAKDKATTMGHINRSHLDNSLVCYPTDKYLTQFFSNKMTPLVNRIIETDLQSNTLSSLRNVLLPKLLNGDYHTKYIRSVVGRR